MALANLKQFIDSCWNDYVKDRSAYPSDKRKCPEFKFEKAMFKHKQLDEEKFEFTASILREISETNLKTNIELLSSFPTRHTKSKYINEVAQWLESQLLSYGYSNVDFHEYVKNGYELKNVVCSKNGNHPRVVMVCAHYDCIMEDIDNEKERAPGANDNASGVSSLLEIARILRAKETGTSMQFVFFSGEEQGLWGSREYAQYIKEKKIDLYRLVNLDMIGSPPNNGNKVIIERDLGNQVLYNDKDSQDFAMLMEHMALTFTNLEVTKGPIYSSDYMPFEALGYVVIGVYDGGQSNLHYHSKLDKPGQIKIKYLSSVTKMIIASILA